LTAFDQRRPGALLSSEKVEVESRARRRRSVMARLQSELALTQKGYDCGRSGAIHCE
jgi:hypothetical protein